MTDTTKKKLVGKYVGFSYQYDDLGIVANTQIQFMTIQFSSLRSAPTVHGPN